MDEWIDRVKQGYNTHYGEIKEDKICYRKWLNDLNLNES